MKPSWIKDKANSEIAGFALDREMTFMSLTNGVPVEMVDKDNIQEVHETLEGGEWPTGPPPRRRFIVKDEESINDDDEPPPLKERKGDDESSMSRPPDSGTEINLPG